MNEWIVARINSLKEDLSKKQEYFKLETNIILLIYRHYK